MTYSEQEQELHKQKVATVMVLNPGISIRGIVKQLTEAGSPLDKDYVNKLKNEVLSDQLHTIREEDKEMAIAQFQSMAAFVVSELQKICDEELVLTHGKEEKLETRIRAQGNRIKALAEIRKTFEVMVNLKMDLGIFERHIGKLTNEHSVKEIMDAIKHERSKITDGATGEDSTG